MQYTYASVNIADNIKTDQSVRWKHSCYWAGLLEFKIRMYQPCLDYTSGRVKIATDAKMANDDMSIMFPVPYVLHRDCCTTHKQQQQQQVTSLYGGYCERSSTRKHEGASKLIIWWKSPTRCGVFQSEVYSSCCITKMFTHTSTPDRSNSSGDRSSYR